MDLPDPTGQPFVVRRSTPADAAGLVRLMADEALFGHLMQLPHPSLAAWTERLTRAPEPDRCELSLVAERDGEIVGSAGLHPVGPQLRRRHAAMLGIGVAASARRQGLGQTLMHALCDYADRWAQVLRIELTVYADNEPAIGLYRRFGFEVEGRLRAYAMRGGRYVDALAMARLHPAPPTLPAATGPDARGGDAA